ncbi:MAG: SNF2-related protein, partial [Thermoleophilaceae bacterium]
MSELQHQEASAGRGKVWLRVENRREQDLVFDFPFNEELNDAVKELPRRWFNWRAKHWRVPADPQIVKQVEVLLDQFPELEAAPEVKSWLGNAHNWRALVSVLVHDGAGAFVLRTVAGEAPEDELEDTIEIAPDRLALPFGRENARLLDRLEGADLDTLARGCVRDIQEGRDPAGAELTLEVGDDGEPVLRLATIWDHAPARDIKALPEAHNVALPGRFFNREASWAVAVPADPALAPQLGEFVWAHPKVRLDERARNVLDELSEEHERASATVALSYAEDAELEEVELGGELHPFQRAGVRYALERRRTFIADEQGLGKTVQALAALEIDDAYPAVVVCPASMKLMWEREASRWVPDRSVAVLSGRTESSWGEEAQSAEILVVNYDILEAHFERLAAREPRALVLDESHYVKNPQARRTKVALELAGRMPEGSLRLGLTGTPILNRPEELIAQLRVLGRLKEFGSGARLARRFKTAGSDDRLHWNLRAHCYVRRTKKQVLPQLPSKRQETVPVLLSNEQDYRLAESDVIAWLQSLPLDLKTLDAKVGAAARAEQLVRLNSLRQLAAEGKLSSALAWIEDFMASDEPLVVFAEHIAIQKAVIAQFPNAL